MKRHIWCLLKVDGTEVVHISSTDPQCEYQGCFVESCVLVETIIPPVSYVIQGQLQEVISTADCITVPLYIDLSLAARYTVYKASVTGSVASWGNCLSFPYLHPLLIV